MINKQYIRTWPNCNESYPISLILGCTFSSHILISLKLGITFGGISEQQLKPSFLVIHQMRLPLTMDKT